MIFYISFCYNSFESNIISYYEHFLIFITQLHTRHLLTCKKTPKKSFTSLRRTESTHLRLEGSVTDEKATDRHRHEISTEWRWGRTGDPWRDRAGFEASVGDARLQYDSSRAHLNSAKVSSLSFKGTIKCLIDLRNDAEKII